MLVVMRLSGWNDIPPGYGASFEVARAPAWIRILFKTPFLDRFAYPLLVRRGLGVLHAFPDRSPDELGPVRGHWRVEPPAHQSRPPSQL